MKHPQELVIVMLPVLYQEEVAPKDVTFAYHFPSGNLTLQHDLNLTSLSNSICHSVMKRGTSFGGIEIEGVYRYIFLRHNGRLSRATQCVGDFGEPELVRVVALAAIVNSPSEMGMADFDTTLSLLKVIEGDISPPTAATCPLSYWH